MAVGDYRPDDPKIMDNSSWANIWMCAWRRLKDNPNDGDWETVKMAAQIRVR